MSEMILSQAMNCYLEHLKTEGKSERTLYTYSQDAKQITAFFGDERKLTSILALHIGKFLKSDTLLKLPSGRDRAVPTVTKTIRVLRMFLVWCVDQGHITKLPLPKDVPIGRSGGNSVATTDHAEPVDAACQTD